MHDRVRDEGAEQFVGLLRGARVQLLVDMRLRASSQLSAYARRDDLRFVLGTYERIAYVHAPELAPSDAVFRAYRASHDWNAYAAAYAQLAEERAMSARLVDFVAGREVVALLCAEASAARCHRRLLAELYAREDRGRAPRRDATAARRVGSRWPDQREERVTRLRRGQSLRKARPPTLLQPGCAPLPPESQSRGCTWW